MGIVRDTYKKLDDLNIPKQDIANILPLGMHTKIVLKINARALNHMFEIRTCERALKEFRDFMKLLKNCIIKLDSEWKELATYFKTICEKNGFCKEKKGCGRFGCKSNYS